MLIEKNISARHIALSLLGATALTGCASDRYGYYDAYDDPYGNEVPVVLSTTQNGYASMAAPGLTTPYAAPGVTTPYDRYATPVSYNNANPQDFIGYAGSRYAHRMYSEAFAETVDGQCEEVVTIQYGDTLSDIAEYCDTSVTALLSSNPSIRNPRFLSAGQSVYVPRVRANVYDGYITQPRIAQPRYAARRPAAVPTATNASYTDGEVYIVQPGD
ncbi:MAG: LysM domain-containing protein, partial [Parvularcula sp.]|nr:LysM domain-containing protein [Parvularcula sp.]